MKLKIVSAGRGGLTFPFAPLLLGIGLFFVSGSTALAETVDTYQQGVGVPTGDSTKKKPLKIEYTVMVNGNPVTQTVEVAGIEKWQYTGRRQNETITQWHTRLASERAAATVAKAEKIVEALNAKFANEFQALGQKAVVSTYSRKDPAYPDAPAQDWGRVDWPSGQPTRTAAPSAKYLEDPTKEPLGGGLKKIPGSPGTSSGMSGSIGRPAGSSTSIATGRDRNHQPSYVEAGFLDGYVATVYPTRGETDDQVLMDLASQLAAHGIDATYDPNLVRLTLDDVPDGTAFGFGNTDKGLNFEIDYVDLPATPAAVPEPSTFALLGLGGAVTAALGWRNRRRKPAAD